MATTKVDFKKTFDSYRAKHGQFQVIEVSEMNFLMIDGHGDPNTSPAYTAAIESLYPVAYKLKFGSKIDLQRDYVVPPLEGLWWADEMASFTTAPDKSKWHWTLMLMVPDWIDRAMFAAGHEAASAKNPDRDFAGIRFESLAEALCVQTLHVGSFDDEAPVLAYIHDEFIPAEGLQMSGRHHEIYLSDFRRVAPEKRRTILRQPVTRT